MEWCTLGFIFRHLIQLKSSYQCIVLFLYSWFSLESDTRFAFQFSFLNLLTTQITKACTLDCIIFESHSQTSGEETSMSSLFWPLFCFLLGSEFIFVGKEIIFRSPAEILNLNNSEAHSHCGGSRYVDTFLEKVNE